MTRLRWTALIVLVLLAAATFSFNLPRMFEVVDRDGAPADPVFIAYSYMGSRLNPAHSTTYQSKPLALVRSSGDGRITIGPAFHVHIPFPIETPPVLWVDMAYVPSKHNAWVRFNRRGTSMPGVFEVDADHRRAAVYDLAGRPELWEGTMRDVSSVINRFLGTPGGPAGLRRADPASAARVRELIGHFRQEHDAFVARYGDVDRPRPEMPDSVRMSSAEEQRRWTESVDADLAREPKWGLLIGRLFDRELKMFAQWEGELR